MESTFPVLEVSAGSAENAVWLPQVMKDAGLVKGTSEAARLIKQGGVKVNDETGVRHEPELGQGAHIVKVGQKKFYKIIITG